MGRTLAAAPQCGGRSETESEVGEHVEAARTSYLIPGDLRCGWDAAYLESESWCVA